MSILLITNTIFFPHSRICSRNVALAFGERAVGRGDEEHQVGAGNEVAGQLLVSPDDRVGPRRVHDVDLAEQLRGVGALEQEALELLLRHRGAVAQEVDPVGGRGDAFGEHALAEQRVDEAGLAGVELAGDHQQEEPAELLAGLPEPLQVVGRHVGAEALQRGGQTIEQLAFPGAELLLPLGQDGSAAEQPADHRALTPEWCRACRCLSRRP